MHKLILYTSFIGQENIILPICQSTNQFALDLCEQKAPQEGTAVLTFHQTAGRGQRGNTWQSEAGKNIALSVILKPGFLEISKQFYLNIVSSLAVYETLHSFLQEGLKIKWPNDILCREKKVAGILIENIIRGSKIAYSVIGIGININQNFFDYPQAASLKNFTAQEHDLYALSASLLKHLEEQYLILRAGHYNALKSAYLQRLFRYGDLAAYQLSDNSLFEGRLVGVQEDGRLLLIVGEEVKAFDFKEIRFVYGL